MGDMREIVDLQSINRLFLMLAFALPILGMLIGCLIGARSQNLPAGFKKGLLVGLLGPANWLLWNLYNWITDRTGLDTVRNLVYNLILFACLGIITGFLLRSVRSAR